MRNELYQFYRSENNVTKQSEDGFLYYLESKDVSELLSHSMVCLFVIGRQIVRQRKKILI